MTKVVVEKLVEYPVFLPRCEHAVEPQGWNGYDHRCKNFAKVVINGFPMCRKHAGSYALAMLLEEPLPLPVTELKPKRKKRTK